MYVLFVLIVLFQMEECFYSNYSLNRVVRDLALEVDVVGLCPFRFKKVENAGLHQIVLCLPG